MDPDIDPAHVDNDLPRWRRVAGWVAVAVSTVVAGLVAHFGIANGFRFGWYDESFWTNLSRMLVPYLVPVVLVLLLGLVSLRWPRVGLAVHLALAGGLAVTGPLVDELLLGLALALPILGLGSLYFVGEPAPRRWAVGVLVGLPLLTMVGFGLGPAIRVATRVSDDETGARRVVGNGLTLVWAPSGPGWPHRGVGWSESLGRCRLLSDDGRAVGLDPSDVWRLPTADEVVRSMARHGVNSRGVWDEANGEAHYEVSPDKEPPLWDVRTRVVTWWTSTEADEERAYTVAFDGKVEPQGKNRSQGGTVGFRCAREP